MQLCGVANELSKMGSMSMLSFLPLGPVAAMNAIQQASKLIPWDALEFPSAQQAKVRFSVNS
jgi:hypothetical protein